MLQKFAIGIWSRNDRGIDQCPSTFLYRTARRPTDKCHGSSKIERQVLVYARLHKPRAGVVGNDFGGRQGSQTPDVSVDNSFGISVSKVFVEVGFVVKMAENRAAR